MSPELRFLRPPDTSGSERSYGIADAKDGRAIREFLKREGPFPLPMVELAERAKLAIGEVVEVVGCAMIEAVLDMGAETLPGPKQAGEVRTVGEAKRCGPSGATTFNWRRDSFSLTLWTP